MPQRIEVPGMGIVEFPDDMNDDAIAAAIKGSQPSVAADVAKSGGIGLAKGGIGIAGIGGDARQLAGSGVDWAAGKLGLDPENVQRGKDAAFNVAKGVAPIFTGPTSKEIQGKIEEHTGEFYKPKTTAGKYAQTVGEFAPGILAGPGGLARRAAMQVGVPGVASEAAGQATEGTAAEPWARLGAALVAPSAASRAITPVPSSEARQRLVNILRDEGVESLTAGQRSGNKTLQYAESILGDAPLAGQGASRIQQRGQEQFTEAATRRAGIAGNAGPENLGANQHRLGDEFRDLSARNTLQMDRQFATDITGAIRTYDRVPPSQQRAIVQGYVDDIMTHAQQGGTMPGAQYQEMRSRLSRQSNALKNSDPTLSETLRDMRNALDAGMRRSISPADREAWDTARQQYGAQKTLEKAASRAGEATAEGQIVPANLRNAVAGNNRGAYARGEGDFSELARAGSGAMAPLPNSGTGQRVAINSIATALGGGAGGAASMGNPLGVMGGAAAGAAAPAALGRILMNPVVQRYLGNQTLPRDEQRRLIAALLRSNAALPRSQPVPQIEGR